jgi:hypothetical protein
MQHMVGPCAVAIGSHPKGDAAGALRPATVVGGSVEVAFAVPTERRKGFNAVAAVLPTGTELVQFGINPAVRAGRELADVAVEVTADLALDVAGAVEG